MKKLLPWILAPALLVVIFGTIYVTVQQSQRSAANYPQIQLAEDSAAGLNAGGQPTTLVRGQVNMAASLAPFTIIYDKQGNVVAGSGYLDHQVAKVPLGVLQAAKTKTYNAVTWQPQAGVRIASVSVAAKGYYVLSGRSLKEVEKNESQSLQLTLIGGLLSVALLGAMLYTSSIKH